jgi:hypothetical protein
MTTLTLTARPCPNDPVHGYDIVAHANGRVESIAYVSAQACQEECWPDAVVAETARVMAAGPELADALQTLMDHFDKASYDLAFAKARAALAKARGHA